MAQNGMHVSLAIHCRHNSSGHETVTLWRPLWCQTTVTFAASEHNHVLLADAHWLSHWG